MKVNILGTEYKVIVDNDSPKMKDSDGFCEWVSKKIVIADDYRNDEDALENIDDYIHKVIRHEAFHALFAEMGVRKWMQDEELVDMLAMQYPKIRKIMDACDAISLTEASEKQGKPCPQSEDVLKMCMKHYEQGISDERARANGNPPMQAFDPD